MKSIKWLNYSLLIKFTLHRGLRVRIQDNLLWLARAPSSLISQSLDSFFLTYRIIELIFKNICTHLPVCTHLVLKSQRHFFCLHNSALALLIYYYA